MGKRYNIDELEDDGFEIKPEPVKPAKKPVVEKVAAKSLAPIAPAPIQQPQPAQPAQIVYIDNNELVKELKANNKSLESKIEALVEAVNNKPKSFKLKILRDQHRSIDEVLVTDIK